MGRTVTPMLPCHLSDLPGNSEFHADNKISSYCVTEYRISLFVPFYFLALCNHISNDQFPEINSA